MAMMDALVRYEREPETYAIREMPIPVIGPDEVLVEVALRRQLRQRHRHISQRRYSKVSLPCDGRDHHRQVVATGLYIGAVTVGGEIQPEVVNG